MIDTVACPQCSHQFELGAAMRDQIAADLRREIASETERQLAAVDAETRRLLEAKEADLVRLKEDAAEAAAALGDLLRREHELDEREAKVNADIAARVSEALAVERAQVQQAAEERYGRRLQEELRGREETLNALREEVARLSSKEADLFRREAALEASREGLEVERERALADGRAKLREEVEQKVEAIYGTRLAEAVRERDEQLEQARLRIQASLGREAALLEREAGIAEREERLDVQMKQQLLDERRRIREELAVQGKEELRLMQEQHALREREHNEQIAGLRQNLAELQRRAAQGSMQLQGEAQELVLRDRLVAAFPHDDITDIPKGISGADLLQGVRGPGDFDGGSIIWESKRTKGWSHDWIAKLRDDQRATGAACAVLVTQALPKEVISGFGLIDGVWVSSWTHATAVATAIRVGMLEVAEARSAARGRGEKMAELYSYLTGPDFRNRFQGIVEAFVEMRADLEKEKLALFRLWKVREGQIHRALQNLAAVHGDLRGIAGRQIEDVPALALGPQMTDDTTLVHRVGNDNSDNSPSDRALADFLFTLVPPDGKAVGNGRTSSRFIDEGSARFGRTLTLKDYERCRAILLTTGQIRKGNGRGGSIARMTGDWSEDESQAMPATGAQAP